MSVAMTWLLWRRPFSGIALSRISRRKVNQSLRMISPEKFSKPSRETKRFVSLPSPAGGRADIPEPASGSLDMNQYAESFPLPLGGEGQGEGVLHQKF